MVKQRMSSADAAAEVACLRQRLLGLRLANVYDLDAKVGASSSNRDPMLGLSLATSTPAVTTYELIRVGLPLFRFARASQTYILKLSRSGEDGEKVLLLLESGSRFHTTQMIRDKSNTPSNFTLKLRKHIRTKRLENVQQLGVDRIVDFVFGSGDARHHLILEMYSQVTDDTAGCLAQPQPLLCDTAGYLAQPQPLLILLA